MASITKRGPYQFQALIRRKGFPKQCATFESRKDAERWVRDIESRMDTGRFSCEKAANATTLYDALERYAQTVTLRKQSPRQEQNRIKVLQRHALAERSLASIRGVDIANYIAEREAVRIVRKGVKTPLSANTIRNELAILSNLFTVATKGWGMESLKNPVKLALKPSAPQGRKRRLEDDEEARLLDAARRIRGERTPWLLYTIRLALLTGMRAGELLSICWSQVYPARKYIQLEMEANGNDRQVPLTPDAIAALEAIPRGGSGKVIDAFGTTENLDHEFKRATDLAKIENLRFHDLRHEAASRAATRLAVHELCAAFGWKGVNMVMRYYHPKSRDIADKLAA